MYQMRVLQSGPAVAAHLDALQMRGPANRSITIRSVIVNHIVRDRYCHPRTAYGGSKRTIAQVISGSPMHQEAAALLFCVLVLRAHVACPKRMRQNGETV